jgi:hypothetical protein
MHSTTARWIGIPRHHVCRRRAAFSRPIDMKSGEQNAKSSKLVDTISASVAQPIKARWTISASME